jgi:hypothetical protein
MVIFKNILFPFKRSKKMPEVKIDTEGLILISPKELDEFLKDCINKVKVDPEGGFWYLYIGGGIPCSAKRLLEIFRGNKI